MSQPPRTSAATAPVRSSTKPPTGAIRRAVVAPTTTTPTAASEYKRICDRLAELVQTNRANTAEYDRLQSELYRMPRQTRHWWDVATEAAERAAARLDDDEEEEEDDEEEEDEEAEEEEAEADGGAAPTADANGV